MIKDSGERTEFANGFVRDMHEGKGRFDLLPWVAIWELAKHCEEGAKKYGERNIDKGAPQHSLIDSAFRHLARYTLGETDENHLRSALWNIAWAMQQDVTRPDLIDIPAVRKAHERIKEEEEFRNPHSDVRRCVQLNCFYNMEGFCRSVSDSWNPDFGEKCPDYSED